MAAPTRAEDTDMSTPTNADNAEPTGTLDCTIDNEPCPNCYRLMLCRNRFPVASTVDAPAPPANAPFTQAAKTVLDSGVADKVMGEVRADAQEPPWVVAANALAKLDKPVAQGFAKPCEVFGTFQHAAMLIVERVCVEHAAALASQLERVLGDLGGALLERDKAQNEVAALAQERDQLKAERGRAVADLELHTTALRATIARLEARAIAQAITWDAEVARLIAERDALRAESKLNALQRDAAQNELKRYKAHPTTADPREVAEALKLIEWNRDLRVDIDRLTAERDKAIAALRALATERDGALCWCNTPVCVNQPGCESAQRTLGLWQKDGEA